MKKTRRWLLITAVFLITTTTTTLVNAVAPFKKVALQTTTKATTTTTTSTTTSTTTTPTTAAPSAEEAEAKSDNTTSTGTTKNHKLTGIPQIDYIWDPNLPRELGGFNLSTYPFLSTTPPADEIHFKCKGLHDGFYASIEYKCQVYHHCVYGIRHDFLCANFTAFDQKTFICHFASDVDCEGSTKYWNRNDALYMATTTSTTSTTTTEPPPIQRKRPIARPLRPLRRPGGRRPVGDDYYYEDQEYDDDYYEERYNRRRKQRPRQRRPASDYDEEYEEKRSFSDDDRPRRPNIRNRFRDDDDLEDDYENDRRKYDRPKARNKPGVIADRRNISSRKPGTAPGRSGTDERRSFSDEQPALNSRKDKPRQALDETAASSDTTPRRQTGRRRINTSPTPITTSGLDDLDDYDKPQSNEPDQIGAAEEDAPTNVKTTAKPLEEFVTPKAAAASVFARPRAPPRIARPVPVNEKKKFQYPVQKTATTVSPDRAQADDEYYDDEEYDRTAYDDVRGRRRNHNDEPVVRKSTRTTIRKPTNDKKPAPALADDEEYDNTDSLPNDRFKGRGNFRKRPYHGRTRGSITEPSGRGADVDFVDDDDYDEQPLRSPNRLRPRTSARKGIKKARIPIEEEDEEVYDERPLRSRSPNRRKNATPTHARLRQSSIAPETYDREAESAVEDDVESPALRSKAILPSGRPASVRVVKRPFLPSRGGSPYLPRGLHPVGIALKPLITQTHTTDNTPINMGSTISGVHLLEHGAPILRDSGNDHIVSVQPQGPRTTLPPRSPIPLTQLRPESPEPKATLDELYETDYDVTLNDALNPTLKPLSPHQNHHHYNQNIRNYPSAFASEPAVNSFVNNNQSPAIYHNNNNNNYKQQTHHQNAYQSVSVPHQSQSQTQSKTQLSQFHQQQELAQQTPHASNNYNSDSYFSSTDIRRRAIVPAQTAVVQSSRAGFNNNNRGVGVRIAQHFYDDFEY